MESEHKDEMGRTRDEVADILASALLDLILGGKGPGTDTVTEGPGLPAEDEDRPRCR